MYLDRLNIIGYRNITQADLAFSPKLNGFIGHNGMGKTNLLDAIYYLSFCKGAASQTDSVNIHHEADFFMLQGHYSQEDTSTEVVCSLRRGGRKHLKRDGKDYKRFSEHVGRIPLVMLSPSDQNLVLGGSEERRRFMDAVISQYDAPYLAAVMRYERTLRQRNALLKGEAEPDESVLDVLDELLSADARLIYAARQDFLSEFSPLFAQLYSRLSPRADEEAAVSLATHASRGELAPILREWRQRERIVGHTLHGPHRDDLEFLLGGFQLKREGSQGQMKTFVIAMKLAQYVFLRQRSGGEAPILLLDDIFDKLDAVRVALIVDFVGGEDFGQIFITDTNREHLDSILSSASHPYRLFSVEEGRVSLLREGGEGLDV